MDKIIQISKTNEELVAALRKVLVMARTTLINARDGAISGKPFSVDAFNRAIGLIDAASPPLISTEEARAKVNEIMQTKNVFIAQAKEQGKKLIASLAENFFALHPEVEMIQWQQFTPYFNDGEECVFRIHDPYVKLYDAKYSECGDYENGFLSSWNSELAKFIGLQADTKQLGSDMQAMKELLEISIGDHAQVTVTRDGIKVSRYDHE